jgi:hypothetical protein
MAKHSTFRYMKPGPGFLDHRAQAREPITKSHRPQTIEQPTKYYLRWAVMLLSVT